MLRRHLAEELGAFEAMLARRVPHVRPADDAAVALGDAGVEVEVDVARREVLGELLVVQHPRQSVGGLAPPYEGADRGDVVQPGGPELHVVHRFTVAGRRRGVQPSSGARRSS